MTLTVARFDLDERQREPNVARPTPAWSPLPIGFPFLVDADSGEVVEPVLGFLIEKCAGAKAYKKRRWARKATADAYAADLKDWWAKVAQSGRAWHEADDELVEDYLLDMHMVLSEHSEDFLADATIARRRSSLNEFHKHARRRHGHRHLPIASTRGMSGMRRDGDGDELETFDAFTLARYDANPRPLADDDVPMVLAKLGPRPGDASAGWVDGDKGGSTRKYRSSRTRMAFEIALATGLRIDEVVNLKAKLFDEFDTSGLDEDDHFTFELEVTKGLVRRTVYFPIWLVDLLKAYIAGERADAVKAARRLWLKGKSKPPGNLFLNSPGAGRHVGKRTTSKRLDADFHKAIMELELTVGRTKAEGTESEHDVDVAAHSFHDGRHTFASHIYRDGMGEWDDGDEPVLERRFEDVVQNLRLRLGHQHVETTINIYLRVFNREGEKALRRLSKWVRAIINRERKNA